MFGVLNWFIMADLQPANHLITDELDAQWHARNASNISLFLGHIWTRLPAG
jgi:hypothetical protein